MLLWLALILVAHDAFYRINARLFHISVQTFDAINNGGIAAHKTCILFFNLVPNVALVLAT